MQRSKPLRQTTVAPPPPTPPARRYHVARYGTSRNFAAYDGEQTLIAVTLYRKGAEEVTARLAAQDRRIAALERQLAALASPPVPPALPSPEPSPIPAWSPPRQLDLLAAEDIPTYRTTRRRPAPAPRRS